MKRDTLITSLALLVIGFITARVGDNLSTVNESGLIQDSILLPLGAILFFLGLLALTITIIWFLVDFIKARLKKGKA
jgi:hypothetical protein